MIKITKKLIKEIIRLDNPTSQDIEILSLYIAKGLHNLDNSKLFYLALRRYNYIKEVIQKIR